MKCKSADDITVEIKEEAVEHHVFQAPTAIELSRMLMQMLTEAYWFGFFTLKTGTAATTGNIVVILRHEPIKC
jgi:hypothetical protein